MLLRSSVALVLLLALQPGQPALQNGDFEEGALGSPPPGWVFRQTSADAGYTVTLTSDTPKSGARAALLARDLEVKQAGFGNLMQSVDAAPFRGRRVTYRASVRTAPGSRAQLWMRVDRTGGGRGFFDNMGDRPIMSPSWSEYRIEGNVDMDASAIYFGVFLTGEGKAWIDAASIDSAPLTVRPPAPPRALGDRGRDNVVAFTRLLGYVRYFHPSDEAARADWDAFTIASIDAVEVTATPQELAQALQRLFAPLAPTLRVFAGTQPSLPAELQRSPAVRAAVTWKHRGLGLRQGPVYASERVVTPISAAAIPAGVADPAAPLVIDLGRGVKASVPIALWGDGTGTLPRAAAPPATPAAGLSTSAADRATRLASVAIAWNVFEHFYPYFDDVRTDWRTSLRETLTRAAIDRDEETFLLTLRLMVAQLRDGHGNVVHKSAMQPATLPVAWDWIENTLVITRAAPGDTSVRSGDAVLEVDGRPAAEALAERERYISGATPQWLRWRALAELASGRPGEEVALTVRTGADPPRRLVMKRSVAQPVKEARPEKLVEIRPGIYYVDPARLTDREFTAALAPLAGARGIVFDMRGYPTMSPVFIQHLIDAPVQSAQWQVPVITRPDRVGMTFDGSGRWNLPPLAPRLAGKIAFVTDGRAISYAESCLGIVEHYKLGEIVGGPTAGTNGNVNPLTLPGGYTIAWTGMKVLKHDGSRHHGVGIQPTLPVRRTIKGVTEGIDELLERAVQAVSR